MAKEITPDDQAALANFEKNAAAINYLPKLIANFQRFLFAIDSKKADSFSQANARAAEILFKRLHVLGFAYTAICFADLIYCEDGSVVSLERKQEISEDNSLFLEVAWCLLRDE